MTKSKTPIWRSIQSSLTREIADGILVSGDKLPTEAELAIRFGVNRHTVRHALGAMAEDGLVHARRGAGVFVTGKPTDYPIGKRVRFHQNIRAAGQMPAKTRLQLATRRPSPREAKALQIEPDDQVHCYEGLSLADAVPIAIFRSIFPAERFPDLLEALDELDAVTAALKKCGLDDYTRISTRLTARLADATQAGHLRISQGAPILRSEGVNADSDGVPVEYGTTWFSGDRVTLTLRDDA
ncbi:phosphonate metabolism transcriptional regulator PhnF [Falsihalocynthiibacter sp. SS001]|uniref:phosphonate metabolism transcriptional regulator PhnF n=1 Tax=Falsihalocynthiibacter sp. SS001 TaxID=3349698 RepID=UPI0036D2DFFB